LNIGFLLPEIDYHEYGIIVIIYVWKRRIPGKSLYFKKNKLISK